MASVLLVENDPDQVEIRQLLLEREGHTVRTASNLTDADAEYKNGQFQAVLMDLRVPTLEDGLQLIRLVRGQGRSVCIVVISGGVTELMRSEEASLVDHILRKPVHTQHLLKLLRTLPEA